MARIVKPTGFLKKNYYYMMGGFWFLAGVVSVILSEGILFYSYIPIGLGMMIYGYLIRNKTEEFISWNNIGIIVKDLVNEELTYSWQDIDTVFVSNNHLTIKSGAANGIILDLTGYSEGDIKLLQVAVEGDLQPQITAVGKV